MSLLSFLRKNKQETASGDSEFYSRAEEESKAVRGRSKRKQGNQDSSGADPMLPEKKRARRRLVGAFALVLAAVIGLPMIFDAEPKPLADDIAIQIPSKDKLITPAPVATWPQEEHASTVPDSAHQVAPTPPVVPAAAAATPVAAGTDTKAEHSPNLDKPSVNTAMIKTEVKAEAKPDKTSSAKVEVKPVEAKPAEAKAVVKPSEKADEAARAQAILDGKTVEKTAPAKAPEKTADKTENKASEKSTGKFALQVAALASKDKINELQNKLKSAGIQSYTQKVATQSGERTRIRVGPFATKGEAEKMHAKLSKLGLNGTLIDSSH